jgi:hypothetical protein
MATLEIRDETYEQLAKRAALEQTTVEAFVQPALDRLARGEAIAPTSAEERRQAFSEWQRVVQSRAGQRDAATPLDDSRESIYGAPEGRGV